MEAKPYEIFKTSKGKCKLWLNDLSLSSVIKEEGILKVCDYILTRGGWAIISYSFNQAYLKKVKSMMDTLVKEWNNNIPKDGKTQQRDTNDL